MKKNGLFNWFFYGHFLIALAAAALGWQSLTQAAAGSGNSPEHRLLLFLFLATLGTYTLHRYLSYRRAGIRPQTFRYNLVDRYPRLSLGIGLASMLLAAAFALPFLRRGWPILLWATPLTVFYLTPPLRGWPRLRDLPYVKVLWVAFAWTLMTHVFPLQVAATACLGGPPASAKFWLTAGSRLLFTGSIAILFDFRDVVLDDSQQVATLANHHPRLARGLVIFSAVLCVLFTLTAPGDWPQKTAVSLTYTALIPAALTTHPGRSEDWYAVLLNGLLLWPPLVLYGML